MMVHDGINGGENEGKIGRKGLKVTLQNTTSGGIMRK